MRCKYCFEESMHKECMMPVKRIKENFSKFINNYLEKYVTELIEINKQLGKTETHITFHGGEPLLVGEKLLRNALEIVGKHKNTVISVQTNGTLVDDAFIKLFKEYDVHVGVSLDGTKEMHNAYRKNFSDAGTYEIVMNNIRKMNDYGVIVGALATVTDVSVKKPEEFYQFFVDQNLPFSFNPCFTDPSAKSTCNVLNVNEYIEFYKKMFDLWISDNTNNLPVACFERIISAMAVKKEVWMEVCSFIPDCSKTTVAIDTEGNFYRCLHYCMDGLHTIGNIVADSLKLALSDDVMACRWNYLKEHDCKECDIQEYCYGGCPYVAETLHGTVNGKADTCLSQKAIVHHIYDYIKQYKKIS